MATNPKSWLDKMNKPAKGEIKETSKGMMYISTPMEIEEYIKTVPKGKLVTTKQITDYFRDKYMVDFTCPLTTGIFISIVANANEEKGKDMAAYWRVIKPDGKIYDSYLRAESHQEDYLIKEGYIIEPTKSGKDKKVKDFRDYLV